MATKDWTSLAAILKAKEDLPTPEFDECPTCTTTLRDNAQDKIITRRMRMEPVDTAATVYQCRGCGFRRTLQVAGAQAAAGIANTVDFPGGRLGIQNAPWQQSGQSQALLDQMRYYKEMTRTNPYINGPVTTGTIPQIYQQDISYIIPRGFDPSSDLIGRPAVREYPIDEVVTRKADQPAPTKPGHRMGALDYEDEEKKG